MNSSPKIALLHGWATAPTIWKPVCAVLESRGFKVAVYEMPGYGSRKGEDGCLSFDQLVDDAVEKLAGCQHWIGWSLGSMIALAAAAKTDEIDGVLGISSTAEFCCDAEKAKALERLRESVESDPEKATIRFRRSMASSANRRAVAKQLDELKSEIQVSSKETLLAGLEVLYTTDIRSELNKIDVPVSIISGKDDLVIPCSSGEEVHRLIPNSTYTTLPCGHVPFLECPQQFMEQLFEFTQTITGPATDSEPV